MQIRKLLIIDDDAEDRDSIRRAINKIISGSEHHEARNGKEALEKLRGSDTKPDLILLDLNMPLMNGFEFLRELFMNEILSVIPVIVISTSSNPRTLKELAALGEFPYIIKPDSEIELIARLRQVVSSFHFGNMLPD